MRCRTFAGGSAGAPAANKTERRRSAQPTRWRRVPTRMQPCPAPSTGVSSVSSGRYDCVRKTPTEWGEQTPTAPTLRISPRQPRAGERSRLQAAPQPSFPNPGALARPSQSAPAHLGFSADTWGKEGRAGVAHSWRSEPVLAQAPTLPSPSPTLGRSPTREPAALGRVRASPGALGAARQGKVGAEAGRAGRAAGRGVGGAEQRVPRPPPPSALRAPRLRAAPERGPSIPTSTLRRGRRRPDGPGPQIQNPPRSLAREARCAVARRLERPALLSSGAAVPSLSQTSRWESCPTSPLK